MADAAVPELADAVARAVLDHPAVVRLDGGPLGTLATHLPGRRLSGVRVTEQGEPVEIGVVLRLRGSLPEVTDDLRRRVRTVTGDVPVHVEVADIVLDEEPNPGTT